MSYPPNATGWVCLFRDNKDEAWKVEDSTFADTRNESVDKARYWWCGEYDEDRRRGLAKCVRAEIRVLEKP